MSEISDLVAALGPLKLRQGRTIARLVDRRAAALKARLEEGTPQTEADEDAGYDFVLGVFAAAFDMTPAQVDELTGSPTELPALMPSVMRAAGFSWGEAVPATSPPIAGSNGFTPPSPPDMDISLQLSAK